MARHFPQDIGDTKGTAHSTVDWGAMDSQEPVSTHGDETGDWLWDFEDRYNVASAEDPDATRAVAAPDPRVAEVRRHVRSRDGGAPGEATIPVPLASGPEPRHIPRPPMSQGPSHRAVFIAAAILVVLGVGGLAYALSRGSKHGTPGVALSTPTTPATVSGPFGVTTQPPPSTVDTTATTSVTFPPASGPGTAAPAGTGNNGAPAGNVTGGTGTNGGTGTGGGSHPTTGTTTPSPTGTTTPTTPTTVPAATTVPPPPVTTAPTTPPTVVTTVPTVTTAPSTGTTVITVPFP